MANAQLTDNFGRPISYLRLAVTDRCNLRCFYCMPEEGINYLPKKELLTYEEMERLISVAAELGIRKVRITGGEPFVRRDMMSFLERIRNIERLEELHITTNGVFTASYIDQLKAINISSVNLSLDTLDPDRFLTITRRDEFSKVMRTFHLLMETEIPLKLNMVVMDGKNTDDILPMAELTRKLPVSVRYIEEMPFNGSGTYKSLTWDHTRILATLRKVYPDLIKIEDPENSTASHYKIPGASGNIGIIAAYTRTFCGTCNRIRVTSQGLLKTCLYDKGALDVKSILRSTSSNDVLKEQLVKALHSRYKDGWAAEAARSEERHESMSTIGG